METLATLVVGEKIREFRHTPAPAAPVAGGQSIRATVLAVACQMPRMAS